MDSLKELAIQKERNSGYDLKWIVELSESKSMLPVKRGRYKIALKSLFVTGVDLADRLLHICLLPEVNNTTYLLNNIPVSAVKSVVIEKRTMKLDFPPPQMEYYDVDFTDNTCMEVRIVDNDNRKLKIGGLLVFDIKESTRM